MKCPFLTKISFKKVNQVMSDDTATEQVRQSDHQMIMPQGDQQNFDLSQQTIEMINSSDVNTHSINYFRCKLNIPESSNQRLQIKFPKQFEIKPMINRNSEMEMEENHNSEVINQSEMPEMKNVPHHLVSKMSMMSSKCEDIFYGDVVLEEESQNCYECEIKDKVIKFMRHGKVKYYIQMGKVKSNIEQIRANQLTLVATCKNSSLNLRILFRHAKKMGSFIKAVELNNMEITQERQLQEFVISNQLNSSYSMDSLGFEVQRMSVEDLKQNGDTFDILLFKNRTMMSKVQRILTNSDYDHVAMLLKTSNNQIFILESSSNLGVSVYTIKSLIELPRKKYYFRVGLRRYNGERTYAQLANVQQFIREAIGKKYKFDPMYLLSSQVKKGDTFFCSQLVSQALQKAGIMSKEKPSYKFLPKHFADESLNQQIEHGSYSDILMLE